MAAANTHQSGITDDIPPCSYYLLFSLDDAEHLPEALAVLEQTTDGQKVVLGVGKALFAKAGVNNIPFEAYQATGEQSKLVPAGAYDLALWLRERDEGVLFHRAKKIVAELSPAFSLKECVRGITYLEKKENDKQINHDLSGFEDGTENPEGDDKLIAAIVQNNNQILQGGSCWTLQKWQHQFDWLSSASQGDKEKLIGRSLDDNREFKDNPSFAHVKRTAQESFSPEAFMWRRSMPWVNDQLEGGLMFSCFARSFYPFSAQLNRMTGGEDGVLDGLFQFSTVLFTCNFWCPPLVNGRVDLSFFLKGKL
ncbi:Dyp-type peroxidase [Piscirickettsia litoralis]|uniref:Dyp-type peroxidase C-terminal domain-containing protein n=1 Tax=Piscirickettsia litoralis TaxID=1891921 RepID=A0ABX2ZYU9_9GAMM|nr:Dyp-type peroxidase [Piscirickettsia litoralis]ODN41771.1 hypothetical protein BGC07_00715 [Piscirickettsia litoralis]